MPHRRSSAAVVGTFGISVGVSVVGSTVGVAELHFSAAVGKNVGNVVCGVGSRVGAAVVGLFVGGLVGLRVKGWVGSRVGRCVGSAVVGVAVGMREVSCFTPVGLKVGEAVGEAVGATLQRQRTSGVQKPWFVLSTLNFNLIMPELEKSP